MPDRPIVTVFRSRLRAGAADEYRGVAEEMERLARCMPGFRDFKTFTADDGERVSVVVFDSMAAHRAWRDHPRHKQAQALGRERLYDTYRIRVCEQLHTREFDA
jgi:heme-degrading monooxygenase HmoA